MSDFIGGTAMDAANRAQPVNLDAIVQMTIDLEKTLSDTSSIFAEKVANVTGNRKDKLLETPDKVQDNTLYAVLSRCRTTARQLQNLANQF